MSYGKFDYRVGMKPIWSIPLGFGWVCDLGKGIPLTAQAPVQVLIFSPSLGELITIVRQGAVWDWQLSSIVNAIRPEAWQAS